MTFASEETADNRIPSNQGTRETDFDKLRFNNTLSEICVESILKDDMF